MSLLVDPFNSMALGGPQPPTGWGLAGNGGFVFQYSTSAPFSPIGGLWPGDQYWWSNGSNVITPPFGPAISASIFSGYQLLSDNNTPVVPLLSVLVLANGAAGQQKNFNGQFTFDILDVRLEEDLTISIKTPGGTGIPGQLLDNSGNVSIAFPLNTWYYFDLEVQTSFQTFNGISYISVQAQMYADGIKICDSGNAPRVPLGNPPPNITGVPQVLLQNVLSPAFSFIQYNNPGGTNYCLSQYDIESGQSNGKPPALTTLPSQTPPDITPLESNVKVSQLPIEISELIFDPNVRITQLPIETALLPYTPNVRISQLVIELATQSAPAPPGGWQVKEA